MSRVNESDARTYRPRLEAGVRLGTMEHIPADNFILSADAPTVQIMNPAGAIDVLMPPSNAANKGLLFIIMNVSANTITLKTDGDAAFTQAIAVAAQQTSYVICTGSATAASGWRAQTAAGTQTSP